ncbi:HypC/HybG/HupF family hydrogenase formation chaperone [Halomonas denitrificans]|uniref:HypC/HybG/HupF family hydrogenase formation chaperone n=1 Tax=Halomonas denitrificans TaxID=370769 RepID=UPI001FE7B1FB|nr:HypC/HybG/HupF family hydrogenase formation chaperone [Halomonas denitrificans]
MPTMCLAIPMQITRLDGDTARATSRGIERDIDLMLVRDQPLAVGDFVIVHVGYALQRLEPDDALATWRLLDEMEGADEADDEGAPGRA